MDVWLEGRLVKRQQRVFKSRGIVSCDVCIGILSKKKKRELQRYNRRKCAHLSRDFAATADLPPHCALFSLQLLDLAHRWSEREDNDIHIFYVLLLAATVYIQIELDSALPDPFPDPQQPARPLAHLLTANTRLFAGRQLHNAPSLRTGWTLQQLVNEEYRILGHHQLRAWDVHDGSLDPNLQAAPLPAVSTTTSAVSMTAHRWFLPTCLPMVHKVLLKFTFGTSHSLWTPDPATKDVRVEVTQRRLAYVWRAPLHIFPSFVHVGELQSAQW